MKWGLWLALVGLVSVAESRSINYEFENEHGLDSEQKGTAGKQVTGKYETMDHNGKVIEVKYIADHMGFRIVDEPEVTDKDINSPNAEPEMEPTELMTQTAEETTNEPFDSFVRLTEQEIEPTTHNTLEIEENEGEGEEEEGEETEAEESEESEETEETEDEEAEDEETEAEETEAEETEVEESEAEETEAEETEAEETEAEETKVEGEAENEEENTEALITEEEIKSESIGKELNHTESEMESEAEFIQRAEEEKEHTEEGESMNVETELENNYNDVSKRKGEESENNYVMSDPTSLNKDEASAKAKSILSTQNIKSKSMNVEIELENNDIIINKIKGEDSAGDLNYQLREILQVPTSDFSFNFFPSLPQPLRLVEVMNRNSNELKIVQEVLAKSLNTNSGLSVQSVKQKAIPDELYGQVTEILQLPKLENSFVYYDNQSPDGSNLRIREIDQEIKATPKRMVTISSKHLNNVNPGTVIIENTLVSKHQISPEVVIVRVDKSGVLSIEAQKIKKEIPVETFNKRSSMKIESELIDGKDFSQQIKKEIPNETFNRRSSMNIQTELINKKYVYVIEEPNIVVRQILSSAGTVKSQLVEEAQTINNIREEESLYFLPDSPVASKIILDIPFITIDKSIAESMPKMFVEQEMEIETEVINDLPLPIALIQPKFVRSAPKPIPVLLQQRTTSVHSLEKGPIVLQIISQQPTPKEIKIVEVRGAPKPISVKQVNPDTQVKVLENEQVIYDNKSTKINAEVVTKDVTRGEIKSFKVRDFVRF